MKRSTTPHRSRRTTLSLAAVAAGVLLAAGCSGSGGKQEEESAGNGSTGQADTPRMKIAMVTHAAPGDTFWDIIRKGAKAAAAKDNVELVYSSAPKAADQANLVQNAIDQKVDGIALTAAKPKALESVIAKARKAGIPVVGFNSGLDDWKDLNMLSYFGQDENVAGQAFGERLNELGAKHNVCVVQEQGHVALEARCAGVKKTFEGETEPLYVNGTDMPSVKNTIKSKLQSDESIDYVVTLGAPFALTAADSAKEAGSDAEVATFDLNKELVGSLESGDVKFSVDQQPYLQGYLAVDSLWLYRNNGNFSGGSAEPVLTGPAFIDDSNIEEIAKFAEKGTR